MAISENDRARYETDGAVCVRSAFADWVEPLRAIIERSIVNPGPLVERYSGNPDQSGFFGDRYRWTFDPDVRDFVFKSPAAELAGEMMGASRANIFCDHLFVKEPGAETPTPWHQDLPYWPLSGDQICSIWVALDEVVEGSGRLEFVAGSHRWNKRFRGKSFSNDGVEKYGMDLEQIPDIDADRSKYNLLSWNMEPGDCILFHALAIHGARGNAHSARRRRAMSTRWLGDDVCYRAATDIPAPIRDPGLEDGAPITCGLFPVVWQKEVDPIL